LIDIIFLPVNLTYLNIEYLRFDAICYKSRKYDNCIQSNSYLNVNYFHCINRVVKMKKENKIYIFCSILALLGLIHYLYTKPSISFGYVILAPMFLHSSLIPSKKIREPDYSNVLNSIGILFFILSYAIYFSHIWGIWKNDTVSFACILIFVAYGLFLTWYKGRFWS